MRTRFPLGVAAALVIAGGGAGAVHLFADDAMVVPAGEPAVILVDGVVGSSCLNDQVFEGSAKIPIGNFLASDPECPPEVAVFMKGQAMRLLQATDLWTDAASDVVAISPALAMPVVALNVWVVPEAGASATALTELKAMVADDVRRASATFDENRVGLTVAATVNIVTAGPGAEDAIGDGCRAAFTVRALDGGMYVPSVLNVYYVPEVATAEEDGLRGHYCRLYGAPEIIYMSHRDHSETTLEHELGHALGLQEPDFGHTTERTGFDRANIMWDGLDESDASDRSHLTLGQAYRMNVDARSWVNRINYTTAGVTTMSEFSMSTYTMSVVRRGRVVVCQDTWTATRPCPKVSKDVP